MSALLLLLDKAILHSNRFEILPNASCSHITSFLSFLYVSCLSMVCHFWLLSFHGRVRSCSFFIRVAFLPHAHSHAHLEPLFKALLKLCLYGGKTAKQTMDDLPRIRAIANKSVFPFLFHLFALSARSDGCFPSPRLCSLVADDSYPHDARKAAESLLHVAYPADEART